MRNGRRVLLPNHIARGPLLLLSSVIVMVDQFSKAWVRDQLQLGVPSPFLPGLLQWRWVRNTGAAFSLFSDSTLGGKAQQGGQRLGRTAASACCQG